MAMEAERPSGSIAAFDDYQTFDEYLDSRITSGDIQYLSTRDLSRKLVEHGHHSSGCIDVTRSEFLQRKADAAECRRLAALPAKIVCTAPECPEGPLMQALAARELAVREGRLVTIIFLRSHNSRGQESSAFIDYGERLANGSMDLVFAGAKLEPQPDDLSYYNWTTRTARTTECSSFEVSEHGKHGLAFKHTADHKLIVVDPLYTLASKEVQRTELADSTYLQLVLFDHHTRIKGGQH